MKILICLLMVSFVNQISRIEASTNSAEDILRDALAPLSYNAKKFDALSKLEWKMLQVGDKIEPYSLIVTPRESAVILGQKTAQIEVRCIDITQRSIYLVSDKQVQYLPSDERFLIVEKLDGEAIVSKDKGSIKRLISESIITGDHTQMVLASESEKVVAPFLGIGEDPYRKSQPKGDYIGVRVDHVAKTSPAEKAGILEGDILTKFNQKTICNMEQLQEEVARTKNGQRIVL